MINGRKDGLTDNISITNKDKENDELKKENSCKGIGNIRDGHAWERPTRIEDKEMFKKGMVKEMIETINLSCLD